MTEKKAILDTPLWKFLIAYPLFWGFCFVTRVCIRKNEFCVKSWKNGIFVCNHQQFFDLVWIPFVLRKMRPRKEKLYIAVNRGNFDSSIAWNFLNWFFPVILIDSQQRNVLEIFSEKLKEGHSVFMFPEGTFNLFGHTLLPFYHGASNLSAISGYSLYPMGIENRKMFAIFPFPLRVAEQIETIFFFLFRKTSVRFGTPLKPATGTDFKVIQRKTRDLEHAVANLCCLKPFHPSERVRRVMTDPLDLDRAWFIRAGIKVADGVSVHWRSMAILEKIFALHMEEVLDVEIGTNASIRDKVYLFPHSRVLEKEVVQVAIRGEHNKLNLWLNR